MDLATLKFVVDTKELEDAATKVAELGTAVSKLNKPLQDLSNNTNKVSTATEKASKAAESKAKADEKAVTTTSKLDSLLDKLTNRYIDMAKGSTSTEASVLQLARSLGATTESALKPYRDVLENIRELSKPPFDSAIGSVRSITQEYDSLTYRSELAAKGIFLTTNQLKEYSKIASEIKGKLRGVGLDPTQGEGLAKFNSELKIQQDLYLGVANSVNTLKVAEKSRNDVLQAQLKAQNDAAKANEYLAKEMERVNRLNAEGTEVTSATNNRLIKFEQALKLSGDTAAVQATKLAMYRKELLATQKAAGNRQIDYLSRALGPQITDIGVGLATGQAPLTILLQQGGQLRDQFALAGVAGSEMGKMLVQASKAMVVSIKDIGLAVGQLVTGAIAGTGKAIFDGIVAPFKRLSEAKDALKQLDESIISNLRYTRLMEVANGRMIQSFIAFGKVGIVAVIATLAALAIEYVKVTAAEKELTKSLAMSGAALGMSTADAITYAKSMNKVGIGTMDAMRMISEFASTGADASIPLEEIIKSAQDMQKYVGIASADTMKAFADIAKKPVEGLIDLAKSTGNVTAETILQAEAFVKAGNNAEAARIAQLALRDSNKEVARRMENDLDPLQTLWMDIKSGISKAGEALYDFLKSSTMVAIFRTAWETIAVIVAEVWYVLKATGTEISGIASQIKAVMSGDFAGAAKIGEDMKVNAKIARDEQDKLVASIMNRNKAEKETLTITEDQRKANRNAAKEIEDRIKKEGKGTKAKETKELNDLEKERIQFLKTMSDLEDRASGFTKNYSDQLNILNIGLTEGWLTQNEFNMKLQELNKVQPGVIKAHKDTADALEKFTQAQKKADDALFDSLDVQHQLNIQVLEQTDLLALEGSLIGATDAERKKALATKRLDLQLEKEIAAIKKSPISASEQEAQIARARQRRVDAEKNINTEIANDAATKTLQEYERISNGVTDSIVTALFEGGKAGSKKLRDLIVAELKKPITIVVKAVVDATLGNLIQSFVGGSSGDAIGSFAGSATGSAATGGLSGITIGGATLGAQAGAFGAGVANGFGPLAGMQSGGLATSTSYNLGATYGAPTAGVLAGVYGGRAISGGYSAFGGQSGNSAVNTGTAIGAAVGSIIPGIGTAIGAALGGLLGGATNRLFGRKLTDVGIRGTLGGETGFEGERYTFEKGGTFRKDKTRTSVLEEADRSAIASDFTLIKGSVMELAESAGFGSDAIKDFTTKFQINLKGLSPEDAVKRYQEEFAKIEESMAKAVIGTSGYRRENETNVQALTRIATFMGGVNDAFGKLGFSLYELNLESVSAAQSFVDLFGGIEGFSKAMGFFYDNFFSETEKIENLTTDLTTAFGKLGLELPNTREEFRALVVAAKEAGDDQQVKNLIDLQYAFAGLVPITEDVVDVVDQLTENMKNLLKERTDLEIEVLQFQGKTDEANAALRKIATEGFTDVEVATYDYNESLKTQIGYYKEAASIAKQTADERTTLENELFELTASTVELEEARRNAIRESNRDVYDQINSIKKAQAAEQAAASIAKQTADERTTLENELFELTASTVELEEARRNAIRESNRDVYDQINSIKKAQAAEQAAAQAAQAAAQAAEQAAQESARVQQKARDDALINLKKAVDVEKQIITDRFNTLNSIIETNLSAIDTLRSTNTDIVSESTKEARRFITQTAADLLNGILPDTDKYSKAVDLVSSSIQDAVYATKVDADRARAIFANELSAINELAEPQKTAAEMQLEYLDDLLRVAEQQLSTTETFVYSLAQSMQMFSSLTGVTLPSFANWLSTNNTTSQSSLTPSSVLTTSATASATTALMDYSFTASSANSSNTTAELMVALINEVSMLRAEVRADVANNAKTAKILDRVSPDGQSLQVTVTTN